MTFLAEGDQAALVEAASAVEARSAAEIVVVVRPRSGAYRDVALLAGIVSGLLLLAFLLFSPWEFDWGTILWGPAALGLAFAVVVDRTPGLLRRFTSRGRRRRAVHEAACTEFVDRGVGGTRDRTGLLVYVSTTEGAAEVIADRGIVAAVPRAAWDARVAQLAATVASGGCGRDVAVHVAALGDLLAAALPRSADDVDEIADEVVA